jgi:hypothetical protein
MAERESKHPGHQLDSTADRDTGTLCMLKPPYPAQATDLTQYTKYS